AAGTATATPQQGEVSWAPKITSRDVHIDAYQPADAVRGLINGASPAPGAWALLEGEHTTAQRFKIGRATPVADVPDHEKTPGEFILEPQRILLVCQDSVLELAEVQPAGKKMMPATDWGRGADGSMRLHTSATHPTEFDRN